jgi:ABC-type nickel/cobalt efflux system permease component RcnA
MKYKNRRLIVLAGFVAILIAPLVAYVKTFGFVLSNNHQRWGEFGSAISGVYTPLIAALTLWVLVRQFREQIRLNEHQYDQAHVEQARSDISFYLPRLLDELACRVSSGNTLREILHDQFQPNEVQSLDQAKWKDLAKWLDKENPRVFSFWSAIYAILAGLAAPKRHPYDLSYVSTKQKMNAMLSYETCVALDNFHRCLCGGRVIGEYEFSPLLHKQV